MRALILAAGTGSRLGLGVPKALVPVAGRPIIEWQLDALMGHEITVVAGHMADAVARQVSGRARIIVSRDFACTSPCHSIGLAGGDSLHLILDGDLLLMGGAFPRHPFIGVCPPRSEEPVYVEVGPSGMAERFGTAPTGLEWACVFAWRPSFFAGRRTGHVYEALAPELPLPAVAVDCFEVDTPADLREAERWMAART